MSITCEKTFILHVEAGCPAPIAPTFTIPTTPTAAIVDSVGDYFYGAVYGNRKAIAAASNTLVGTCDVLDFAAGTRTPSFPIGDTGWATAGSIYEPSSGLIVSLLYKAGQNDLIAFIDPSLGVLSTVATALPSIPYSTCTLMRGSTGKVGFMSSVGGHVGDDTLLIIVDALTQSIESTFTIDGSVASTISDYLCYGCATNEFYTRGYMGDAFVRILRVSAVDGSVYALPYTNCYPIWVDSLSRLVLVRSSDTLTVLNPDGWVEEASYDLYALTGLPYLRAYAGAEIDIYNYKLDALAIVLYYDELPIAPFNESTGIAIFKASDFSLVGICKTNPSRFGSTDAIVGFNETTGSIVARLNFSTDYFHEITPTII